MKTLAKPNRTGVTDDYLDLIRTFPLRTLRSDQEHAEAIKILTRLLGRPDGRLSCDEQDYAEILGHLIDEYDPKKVALSRRKSPPLEILKFLMRENDMTTADLAKVLGNKTAASLILNGKRDLSKGHIRSLAARFKVDPGLFL